MSLTIKAFMQKERKCDGEIRRFQIPADMSSSYDYLSKQLCVIFPSLRQGNFSLFWKDPDGDRVSFSTDEELMDALGFVSDSIFKVFIIMKDETQPSARNEGEAVHHRVVCDGCEQGPICGPRYKCLMCPDYDLCKKCESSGIHMEHDMMKIAAPGNFAGGFPFGGSAGPHGQPRFPCGGPQGHHGSGMHGPGPHGPFTPPPHFRRWMQSFMKRSHNHNAPGWERAPAGEKEAEREEKKEEHKMEEDPGKGQDSGENNGEEYLRHVGEAVAAMLDTFGIDVDIDVEKHNKGEKTEEDVTESENTGKCGMGRGRAPGCGGQHGRRGRSGHASGAPGPCGMFSWMGGDPMGHMEQQHGGSRRNDGPRGPGGHKPSGTEGGKPETEHEEDADQSQNKAPENPQEQQDPTNIADFIIDTESKRSISPTRMDAEPTEKTPEDTAWTLLSTHGEPNSNPAPKPEAQVPQQGTTQPGPTDPQVSINHPVDPNFAESLQQMIAMGFSNEGGWLTQLLEAKHGDIIQVLNAIRPQQRSKTTEGGTFA